MKRLLLLGFVGSSALLGGLLGIVMLPRLVPPAFAQSPSPTSSSELILLSDRFESVAMRVAPAVVYIEASKPPKQPGGRGAPLEESGSGVLIQPDPAGPVIVLTNNHVISQAAPEQITVNLSDGRIFRPIQVLADPESDIALLRLDAGKNLPIASLGDSDATRVGQWVLAIGSPFGLNQTVTHGIISARQRGQVSLGSTIRIKDFLQTDAAINPGSSGGPLVNLKGEIIGVNTAIASNSGNYSGISFSIPINLVKKVSSQLLERGKVSRGYLGMQLAQAFEPADALKLGLDRVQGAWVEIVYAGTPAAEAGLKANDVVLQVDAESIRNENHLINSISTLHPGQRIRLLVWRDRKTVTLDATIGDWTEGQGRLHSGR